MSIESEMPSNHLILCRPLLLLPPIPPSIRVFSNESTPCMRWPKYWSFSFNISASSEHPGLISFRMDWLDLQIYELKNVPRSTVLWWKSTHWKHTGLDTIFRGVKWEACCFSVAKLCPNLWGPVDCSMPDFPVLHSLTIWEFAQTRVHWVDDAI